jgi:predicted CoA-substrate-specific enzyme activase
MICAGIDAGSRAVKVAVIDADTLNVLAMAAADQEVHQAESAAALLAQVCADAEIATGDVACTIATGYARHLVESAATTVTEITCHARGVHHLAPEVRTIVEIGGQDSKLLRLDDRGAVRDFAMNDRCAAGTGRFLEMVSQRLDVPLEALGDLAGLSSDPAAISSMCVVFAETEITGLLAAGRTPEDIVAGVQASIAARIAAMAGRGVEAPVVFTGGVAMISGMRPALETVLGQTVQVSPHPQMTGAIGAAILAAQRGRS